MRIEVLADERIGDQALAAALRRIADRLDPPSVVKAARRSRPSFPGIRWDTSSGGTLLTCTHCTWRSGPHGSTTLAEPFARAHSKACSWVEFRRTPDVASTP